MAITQQLARISPERAHIANLSVPALDSIISFEKWVGDVFEDFDWSPRFLIRALTALGKADMAEIVDQALEGEQVLNKESPNCAGGYFVESEIRVNHPDTVVLLAKMLSKLPVEEMCETKAAVAKQYPDSELPDDYPEYVRMYAGALVSFYQSAARCNQAVVTWWD